MPITPASPILIYDGECFFCSHYVALLRLRDTLPGITLLNARNVEQVRALGLEPGSLNDGMVLLWDGHHYRGGDAVHRLALLSTPSGAFNRFNRAIFRHPGLSRFLYPFLKAGRRAYLFLAGKTLIQ
jgi:predicted DCC family thiol-disulfide oxidoreductase YuxK